MVTELRRGGALAVTEPGDEDQVRVVGVCPIK